jgi:hypothetical protein
MVIGIGVLVWVLVREADKTGYSRGTNEALEGWIANEKKQNKVESEVDGMPDADVTKRLSRWKRPF